MDTQWNQLAAFIDPQFTHIWIWGTIAVLFLITEMVTSTFVMLFLAIAAVFTGLGAEFVPMSFAMQLIIFSGLAFLALFFGRGPIQKRFASQRPSSGLESQDHNSTFVLDQPVAAKQQATVTYQGSPWSVVNMTDDDLAAGQRVRVLRTEGIKLLIEKAKD